MGATAAAVVEAGVEVVEAEAAAAGEGSGMDARRGVVRRASLSSAASLGCGGSRGSMTAVAAEAGVYMYMSGGVPLALESIPLPVASPPTLVPLGRCCCHGGGSGGAVWSWCMVSCGEGRRRACVSFRPRDESSSLSWWWWDWRRGLCEGEVMGVVAPER